MSDNYNSRITGNRLSKLELRRCLDDHRQTGGEIEKIIE